MLMLRRKMLFPHDGSHNLKRLNAPPNFSISLLSQWHKGIQQRLLLSHQHGHFFLQINRETTASATSIASLVQHSPLRFVATTLRVNVGAGATASGSTPQRIMAGSFQAVAVSTTAVKPSTISSV
jgi:hypothetical protein